MDCDVHIHQMDLAGALRTYVQRRLRLKLGRHGWHVRTLKFRLTEQESSTGNGTKLCFLVAKLMPAGEVIITETNTDLFAAVSRAIERLKAALGRKVERQRSQGRRRESVRGQIS